MNPVTAIGSDRRGASSTVISAPSAANQHHPHAFALRVAIAHPQAFGVVRQFQRIGMNQQVEGGCIRHIAPVAHPPAMAPEWGGQNRLYPPP